MTPALGEDLRHVVRRPRVQALDLPAMTAGVDVLGDEQTGSWPGTFGPVKRCTRRLILKLTAQAL